MSTLNYLFYLYFISFKCLFYKIYGCYINFEKFYFYFVVNVIFVLSLLYLGHCVLLVITFPMTCALSSLNILTWILMDFFFYSNGYLFTGKK